MPRVTILNQFYTPDISPTAHLSASLAEHLADEGHDVTVIASRGGYRGDKHAEAGDDHDQQNHSHSAKPHVHRVWTPRLGKSNNIKRLADYAAFYLGAIYRAISLPRQDVIISLTTPPYIAWAGGLHKLLHPSTKLVLWSMDCYPDAAERMNVIKKGGLLSRTMRFLNRALFKQLDHLISLDTAMQELLVSQYAAKNNHLPTTIIPNWERAELFPNLKNPNRWEKAAELGLNNDNFVVLYLGNTGYGHHFESVMQAADQLRDEPVTFLMIGGGKRWQDIHDLKTKMQLDNVILHGYVPKERTPSVMAVADCALITLRDNSLGVMSPSKLHSNLAMHLPIIYLGPKKSNVDDAISRYDCGISLCVDDSAGMVEFIRRHMKRDNTFLTMRNRARQAFDSAYVDQQTLPQFSRIVEQVLAPGTSTQPVYE